jgi:hypothetical protein
MSDDDENLKYEITTSNGRFAICVNSNSQNSIKVVFYDLFYGEKR